MAKKDKFDYFKQFEKLSELAIQETDVLIEAIENFTCVADLGEVMERAKEIEHKGDEINHDIYQQVARDFITPFDREDILELCKSFDNIIDYGEDIIRRFYMYDVRVMRPEAIEFAKLIRKSCVCLNEAMGGFHEFKKSKKFKAYIVEVNDYEEQADQLLMEGMRKIHTVEAEHAMHVHVWAQLLERFEGAADACEHTADVMSTIVLKNA